MTFTGTALEDITRIRQEFPREFTHSQLCEHFGWEKARARQAIVMGVSQDYFRIVGAEDSVTQWVTYENVAWRRQWMTKRWGVSDERRELAG
jgi:hypothetical protein